MNTRVQVEHCVTEMTTGIDIVKEGIRAAAGEELSYAQADVELRGHAIECRINAEDASKNFAPGARARSAPTASRAGPGVRVDSGVEAGGEVSPMYDPMVAKLIVWDADREQATKRMLRALGEYEIEGLKTLIPFHQALLATEQWAKGETCRDLLEDKKWLKTLAFPAPDAARPSDEEEAGEGRADLRRRGLRASASTCASSARRSRAAGRRGATAPPWRRARGRRRPSAAQRKSSSGGGGADTLPSPLQGNMWKVLVKQGDTVEEGQLLCIIEAMKMENEITAHKAGTIAELPIAEGEPIQAGAPIATITSRPAGEPQRRSRSARATFSACSSRCACRGARRAARRRRRARAAPAGRRRPPRGPSAPARRRAPGRGRARRARRREQRAQALERGQVGIEHAPPPLSAGSSTGER